MNSVVAYLQSTWYETGGKRNEWSTARDVHKRKWSPAEGWISNEVKEQRSSTMLAA